MLLFLFPFQNPFYEIDMPIRVDLFNRHLEKLIQKASVPTITQGKKRSM
jgi:hypothetical protein